MTAHIAEPPRRRSVTLLTKCIHVLSTIGRYSRRFHLYTSFIYWCNVGIRW